MVTIGRLVIVAIILFKVRRRIFKGLPSLAAMHVVGKPLIRTTRKTYLLAEQSKRLGKSVLYRDRSWSWCFDPRAHVN